MTDIHTAEIIKSHIDAQPEKEYTSWRASSIGNCLRQHFYRRLGVKPTIQKTDGTLRKFKAGDLFHDFIQGITIQEVEKQGGVAVKEVELYDKELDLGGRYDLMIELENRRVLKDIKSQNSRMFHKLRYQVTKKLGKKFEESSTEERQRAMQEVVWEKYPHWVMQIAAYMVLLKRAGTPVDEGVIVRVSKDDLSLAEIHYPLTEELENRVLEELTILNKHWKAKTLPPCTCGKSDWGTMYCEYGDPKSEAYVEVTPDSGKTYKRKQVTKCCAEKLLTPDLWEKQA